MGLNKETRVLRYGSVHSRYANYQKEDSLHEKLEKEGFTKSISAIKKNDKDGLMKIIDSFSRGCYKIAIVDGSEIGAKPSYLPKPLSSYYMVYVKDVRGKKGKGERKEKTEERFRDEHGIERTVEDSGYSRMTDHHGREFPFPWINKTKDLL